jgi:hypothetical protein
MFSSNPVLTVARERIIVPLLRVPGIQRAILSTSNQLDVNYRKSRLAGLGDSRRARPWRPRSAVGAVRLLRSGFGPRAGDRAPDAELYEASGAPTRLLRQLHGPQFNLLIFTGRAPAPARLQQLAAFASRVADRLGTDVRTHLVVAGSTGEQLLGPRCSVLLDLEEKAHRNYRIAAEALYLVRPDGYVGVRCPAADLTDVEKYLDNILEPGHPDGLSPSPLSSVPSLTSPVCSSVRSHVHADR